MQGAASKTIDIAGVSVRIHVFIVCAFIWGWEALSIYVAAH